jgi:hypothetical protein
MVSGNQPDAQPRPNELESPSPLARLLIRMFSQLFGGSERPPRRREAGPFPTPGTPAPNEASAILQRALQEVESMPRDLAELKRSLGEIFHELEDALAQLGVEARRLSEESSRLAVVASKLEDRLGVVVNGPAPQPAGAAPRPAAPPPPPAQEPTFQPGNGDLGIVLASVPGFQGLMDVQRALSGLPEAENASVVGFRNGEAALEVSLRAPVTVRRIVDELRGATGHPLQIEEARPDALRLRLRFTNGEGRG